MGEPAASPSPGAGGDPSGAAHNAPAAVGTAPSALPSSAVQFQSSPGVATARSLKPQVVRIEVLGDDKVGKTSLICSLVSRHFSERVPAVLLNVQIPAEENNENVIISITDTSSRVSDLVRVANATKRSDAILLVYDLTRPETIQRLRRWLDLIARHKEVPVVLVGNKDDIKTVVTSSTIMDGLHSNQIRQLTTTYQFAVDGGDCSARNFAQVARAFYYAQKAVLYPVEPLYNGKKRVLEPKCVKAIKRTFRLFDRDRDGLLSRDELNDYQQDCFGMRLLPAEMDTMMEFLQSTIPEGVKEDGSAVRFHGFLYLWQLFIDRKRPESCWQVLRSLGYNNEIQLEIPPERIALVPHESDQSAQLTKDAVEFLDALLRQFDGDKDGNLTEDELDEIFSICEDEEPPWRTCSAIATPIWFATTLVADRLVLSRAAWLALWSFVAQENPEKLLETFFCLGFNDKLHAALEFTKSRSTTRQASVIERNVVTCYLYASTRSLKTRLASALVGRKTVTTDNGPVGSENENEEELLRAVNAVTTKDTTTYLLLTEALSESEVDKRADVLCFLLDPLDPTSWAFAQDMDAKLSREIPRLFLGVKPDAVARTSVEWEDTVRLAKATNTLLLEDDKSTAEAFERLVRTATRPPNAHSRRSRLGRWPFGTTGTLLTLVVVAGVGALCFEKNRERVREAALVVREASAKMLRA